MHVAIIEVSEPNHYSAVNGLLKTYASDPSNRVVVYTLPAIEAALREGGIPPNGQVTTYDPSTSLDRLLSTVEDEQFDRVHVCTIFDNSAEFARFNPPGATVFLHVHQCEEWYNDTTRRALRTLYLSVRNKDQNRSYARIVARQVVDYFRYRPQRKQILDNFARQNQLRIIVHSEAQRATLLQMGCREPITVFPFAIYEGLADESNGAAPIEVCIPGVITQSKRDYLGLFEQLHKNADRLRGLVRIHLLGFINDKEQEEMSAWLDELVRSGVDIRYHDSFVYGDAFDDGLARCDVLLNNQLIDGNNSETYGKTKESGAIFNMLRAAKPGLLPAAYTVSDEFLGSTIFYTSNQDLIEQLIGLARGEHDLTTLRAAATSLSQRYLPGALLPRLTR